jgi:hypothetical protein
MNFDRKVPTFRMNRSAFTFCIYVYTEYGDNRFLRNTSILLPDQTASYPRKRQSS